MIKNCNSHPPVTLVKTWIDLITSEEPGEVRRHAGEMLLKSFGDMDLALAFAKDHGLINENGVVQSRARQ